MIITRSTKTQPKSGWVFSLSVVTLLILAAFCIIDESSIGAILESLIIASLPIRVGYRKRLCLIALGIANSLLGTLGVVVMVPLALWLIGMRYQAVLALLLFSSVALLAPYLQNIPSQLFIRIQASSLLYIVIPAWCVVFVLRNYLNRSGWYVLWLSPLLVAMLIALASRFWLSAEDFTSPAFRLLLAVAPAVSFVVMGGRLNVGTRELNPLPIAIGLVVGMVVGFALPAAPINAVLFDESHGKWETVTSSFGENDFGRSANYTYSKLYKKFEKLYPSVSVLDNESDQLPSATDSLLILKMPSVPLSKDFISRIGDWVQSGGRLLVIADHTDLYDTTQNLNELLGDRFGLLIKSDAVSDRFGMPNTPRTKQGGILFGRIDANAAFFPWQTGSSLLKYPLGGVQLSTYGLGFSEDANYSRANRFGTFEPDITNRYLAHTSIVAKAIGSGGVVLLLDSTPWSNFSIFKAQYIKLYKGIVSALERMAQIRVVGLSGFTLLLFAVILSFRVSNPILFLAGASFGLAISSAMMLGMGSFAKPENGKDFKVAAVLGNSAKTEILKQLVYPGEANYSRILSSLGKYDLDIMALPQGEAATSLNESNKWLFIEPSDKQLPKPSDLLAKLQSGDDVVILFSSEHATDPKIRNWLQSLGLHTAKRTGLSLSDFQRNERGSLIGGRAAALGRSVFVVSEPSASSLLKVYETDNYIQTYTVRPSSIPRESGLLSIGFSSRQFSDDVIGDVWEGTQYSSLGKLREKQMASILADGHRVELMPNWMHRVDSLDFDKLPQFVVAENGKSVLSGELPKIKSADPTIEYFVNLRAQAANFVSSNCPRSGQQTMCSDRLLANDMIEWIVTWKGSSIQNIDAIELIHERGMSGLGSTWNVVFGK